MFSYSPVTPALLNLHETLFNGHTAVSSWLKSQLPNRRARDASVNTIPGNHIVQVLFKTDQRRLYNSLYDNKFD